MATDMVRRVEVEGEQGMAVDVGDTWLFVAERGDPGGLPLFVLHGGPGDDHHEFADYLDPLGVGAGGLRLLLVDQRAQGRGPRDTDPATWTLEQMARDVSALAASLGAQQYAVLGHSYGAMVALQHLVDAPGATVATVVSHGVASSGWFAGLDEALTSFEPVDLRAQVAASWAAEETVSSRAEFAQLMRDQAPFHFADPRSVLIADYQRRSAGTWYGPEVLRAMAPDYGAIEVVDRLGTVTQPVLVLAGRADRVCPVGAAEQMVAALPDGSLHVFEQSGHMSFVEQNGDYLQVVRDFLNRAAHR